MIPRYTFFKMQALNILNLKHFSFFKYKHYYRCGKTVVAIEAPQFQM